MNYKITEDEAEMILIGKQVMADNPRRYPKNMLDKFIHTYWEFLPNKGHLTDIFYSAVYNQQIYGTSLIEHSIYGFKKRTHAEKIEYITWCSRYIYTAFLNKNRDLHLLDNKYEAYSLLKPYYKREAMLLTDENDFTAFCNFTTRHKSIFVKPVNMDLAEGVHRLAINSNTDLKATFFDLLDEAKHLSGDEITRPIDHRLLLEEEIIQSPTMAQFNPNEMSLLRVTTILLKDKVHFFYPCIRMMCGDGKSKIGELYSLDALIDTKTGVVITNGIDYSKSPEFHPVTGVKIKGFVMPQWKDLLCMLEEVARKFPTLRYIGWDVTHTQNGWCIIEGNPNGELSMSQMCAGHGLKTEFENIIGFHIPFGFMLERVEQLIENKKANR